MDQDHEPTAQPVGPASAVETKGEPTASTTGPRARKRTKTGCLTCRKRRIKCGEERPTCVNCIKSKRHCDGYNQRIVFKPPNSWSDALTSSVSGHHFSSSSSIPGAQFASQSTLAHALTLPSNSLPVGLLHRPFYGIPIDESGRPLVDQTLHPLTPFSPDTNSTTSRFEVGSAPPPFDQSPTASFSPSVQSFASSTSVPSIFTMNDGAMAKSPQDQFDIPFRSPELPSSLSVGQREQAALRATSNGVPLAPDPSQPLPTWGARESSAGFFSQDGFVYNMQNLTVASNLPSAHPADRPSQYRGISRSFDGMPLLCGCSIHLTFSRSAARH
jgi:hypothetical protein